MSLRVEEPRRRQGNVTVTGSSGMGVNQAGGGSTQRLQATHNPQQTFNPQRTAPSTVLQNTFNPQQTQQQRTANAQARGQEQANAIIAAIEAANPMPQLPSFNSSAQRAQARNAATKKVNPVYQAYLDEYLKTKQNKIGAERSAREFNKESLEQELARALEDSGIRRDRTTEDTETQLEDTDASQQFMERTDGTQFDRARSALLDDVADAGLTESGIGQGIVQDTVNDRNVQSEEQGRQFDGQREQIETFKTRTFQDLDTSDTRATDDTKRGKKEQDRLLDEFITAETDAERQFRLQNERDRLNEINTRTQDAYSTTVANKAAELARSGRSQADVDYFLRVYGR